MTGNSDPAAIVQKFWALIGDNDFTAASECLCEDYCCRWPQSAEIIAGRAMFIAVNAAYPVTGKWRVDLHSLTADEDRVVADVTVSDAVQSARCIGFYRVRGELIRTAVEWWPDAMQMPDWRRGMTLRDADG